jgi:lysozyme
LSYNIGDNAFKKSSVLKAINEGKMNRAAARFMDWKKSEGAVMDGLILRRAEEIVFFRGEWWKK